MMFDGGKGTKKSRTSKEIREKFAISEKKSYFCGMKEEIELLKKRIDWLEKMAYIHLFNIVLLVAWMLFHTCTR